MKRANLRYCLFAILLFGATLMAIPEVEAQCAMCRAVAENSIDDKGYGLAMGLNNGILFLMFVPYLLLATLFLVFFRKRIMSFLRSFNNIHSH